MFKVNKQRLYVLFSILAILLLGYWFSLPKQLFIKPTSTVIQSREGELLGARVADDGQWRFPMQDGVPIKFEKSILTFEDKYFYYHPGVNIISLIRAAYQDIKARKIVSGGSTISMQVIRLSQDNPPRTFLQKFKEIILSTRLELGYSKKEILNLYAANAPFGSNVVGIEAASWRFFGRPSKDLSWSESALLAVLPNAPSLLYPGKNENKLLEKRNRLLHKMMEENIIDSLTYSLSVVESLPSKVKNLPNLAPHLLARINEESKGKQVKTTLDYGLQKKAINALTYYSKTLNSNKVYNAAVIIVKISSGEVLAYIGNTQDPHNGQKHGNYVDIIQAPRSSGSILKPILYAYMLQEGKMLPKSLIPDIPTVISGYQPQNFDKTFRGAVHADEALQKSLNVPAVIELQKYGYPRFCQRLKELGFTTINKSADHYGLSLILGGAEVTLWDLAKVYSSMARVLKNSEIKDYDKSDWRAPSYIQDTMYKHQPGKLLDASAIWLSFDAMQHLNRPIGESGWNMFSSSRRIAWKTGTSHGFRDAWAVGVDADYFVGVWVGNADGEGRPGMTGLNAAAPFLFQSFDMLPESQWFTKPDYEMITADICEESGFIAGPNCPKITKMMLCKKGEDSPRCPFHKLIHLDAEGKYRVNSKCYPVNNMMHKSYFVLPPTQAWFYKQQNPFYEEIPQYNKGCEANSEISMEMIYPKSGAKVFVPIELNGKKGAVVFEAAHKTTGSRIYWHMDNTYLGYTKTLHQMTLSPSHGKHKLTLVDETGESLTTYFEVVNE